MFDHKSRFFFRKKYWQLFEEELDPEIAALLDDVPDEPKEETASGTSKQLEEGEEPEIAVSEPSEFFNAIIEKEKKDLVEVLQKNKALYENPPSKEEKSFYRERLIAAYWNFYRELAKKITRPDLAVEKQMCLRYSLLDTNWINDAQLDLLKKIPLELPLHHSILYIDQWLAEVTMENIKQSVMDETKVMKQRGRDAMEEKLEKKQGMFESEKMIAKNRVDDIVDEETNLKNYVEQLLDHDQYYGFGDDDDSFIEPYTDYQRSLLGSIQESCRRLSRFDKALREAYRNVGNLSEDVDELENVLSNSEEESVLNKESLDQEISVVRQMIKLCVGRQGNHFPILQEHYFSADPQNMATIENIEQTLSEIEYLDPSLFIRTYKGEENRIEPYFIIVPCYGDQGICWEPFSRHNRATSKGRIAVPLFPKNLKTAIIYACADLRWQVAKEKAQHYWMEEGITGKYYEFYTENKLKGDIKRYFIQDYYLWITMESKGMQKLDRKVRQIFWRLMPFPQEIKEELKNKGFFYSDLYKKDQNIARSDGY